MIRMIFAPILFSLILIPWVSSAETRPLRGVATLADIQEVMEKVGGDQIEVQSILRGNEDPHFLDATPAMIRMAAEADLFCSIGLELEIGWVPRVLQRSGRAQIQSGGAGFCELGRRVDALEVPRGPIDRSMGDVHASGNPHFNLSPTKLAQAAEEVFEVLVGLRPEKAAYFTENLVSFREEMKSLRAEIYEKVTPVRESGARFIEYHKDYVYFFHEYDLVTIGAIEEVPGLPPSAARVALISQRAKSENVRLALAAPSTSEPHLRRFSELSGVPHRRVPTMLSTRGEPSSIRALQLEIAEALLEAID